MNPLQTAGLALVTLLSIGATTIASAKLPPPSDEAKAKAAEAAAKTAHTGKVDNFKLCKSMDRVAQVYFDQAKKAGKAASQPTATPACEDPGPFVYTPPAPAAATPVPAAAAPAAPPPAAPKK